MTDSRNKPRVSEWLQIGANVGILAGLILVAVQIRDANLATDTQFEFEGWTGPMTANQLIIGEHLAEAWAKAAVNSDELTDTDLIVINSFLTHEWLHNARMLRVAKAGFDQMSFDTTADKWMGYLGNKTSLRWWHSKPRRFFDSNPDLWKSINQRLAERGAEHATGHQRMLNAMRAGPIAAGEE